MWLTVLRFCLVLVTILVVDVYSSCLFPKTCPCGTSGKNYTRCYDIEIEQYSCERWANCQTCNNYELCVTCPPGRSGPTCKDGSCPFLKRPKNGLIQCSYDSTSFRSCTARCFPGYHFENLRMAKEITLNCEQNTWTPRQNIPDCKPTGSHCTLRGTGNHSYNCTTGMHGSYCDINCEGKRQGRYHCYPGKGWNSTLPSCVSSREQYLLQLKKEKVVCSDPRTPKDENKMDLKRNSINSQHIFREGDILLFFCRGGNTPVQRISYLSCKSDARWDGIIHRCEPFEKEEYMLLPKKEKVVCPDPGTPKDGGRMDLKGNSIPSKHIFRQGDSLLFFCKGRNTPFDRITYLTCEPDATWAGIIPRCEPFQKEEKDQLESSCKHPGVVENGIIEDFESDTEQFPVGTELRFLCREGYQIKGPEAIYCLLNLSWSEAPPVCTSPTTTSSPITSQLSCKHPGTVENGFIVGDEPAIQSFPLGSELRFQCNEGHELVGANAIFCLHSGQRGYWSDVPPFCRYVATTTTSQTIAEIYCKHPGVVENGVTENYPPETKLFPVGTALKFQCRKGYELVGPTNLYCMRNGEWSQGPPNCKFIPKRPVPAVSCVHPGMVENGRFEGDLSKTSFPAGTALKFHCSTGTKIEGPGTLFCKHTGQWSQAPPTCKSIIQQRIEEGERAPQLPCKHPGTIDNGVNEYSASKFEVYLAGSEIKFKCREGYTLDGPDTLRCGDTGEWTSALPTCRPTKKIPDCGRVFQDVYKQTGKYTRSDWPWTVGISTVDEDDVEKIFCAGALLNSKTVLTAAHCATSSRNINLHFGHPRQSVTGASKPEQVRTIQISRVVIHPEYDDETHANDIALMKFEPHIHYDRRTQTVCLPTPTLSSSGENLFPGTKALVTGYGLHFAANHSSAAKFTMLEFPVQNEMQCEEVCRGQGLVSCNPSTFCAGYPKHADECVYGGSPLVVLHPEKNRYTLEGLVTRAESARNRWNGRCKRPESYTTFTNVTHFMPFIMKHLNSKNE